MKIGVLSDTHLTKINRLFIDQVQTCFKDCPIIFHAGDLTDIKILKAFQNKDVHAVHGNMCQPSSYNALPRQKVVEIAGFKIGLSHGREYRFNVEEQIIHDFPKVDCIISGHTHTPVCHNLYDVLFVNPGSFTGTGTYGSLGTYAILEIDQTITGDIYEVQR